MEAVWPVKASNLYDMWGNLYDCALFETNILAALQHSPGRLLNNVQACLSHTTPAKLQPFDWWLCSFCKK